MEDNILAHSNLIATAEEIKTIEDYLAEILRLRTEIDAEQEEIERIKTDLSIRGRKVSNHLPLPGGH